MVANQAAEAARNVTRNYYGEKLRVDDKNGDGPVTIADQEAEQAMVSIILDNFPTHAVFGEKTGWTCNQKLWIPDFFWVLDPVDGKESFIANRYEFGIPIALLYKGKPVLGIIDQPVYIERWNGVSGRKTTRNGEEVSVCAGEQLDQGYLYTKARHYNDDAQFANDRMVYKVRQTFYGGNYIAYGLLASGSIDLIIDCALDPFDFLALIPIVEGAGGFIIDWEGHELFSWEVAPHLCSVPEGGFKVLVAGNRQLHEKAVLELSSN